MDFASYVSGFVDGEGCFSVSFNLREKLRTGIEVRPSFAIAQNKRNLAVIKKLHAYFGCGAIRFSKNDQCYKYEVRDLKELRERIVPHFKQFPLLTSKQCDFEVFEEICDRVAQSKHRNPKHLREIIALAYAMNGSGKRKYAQAELLRILDKMKI